jgi:hypothetical protein
VAKPEQYAIIEVVPGVRIAIDITERPLTDEMARAITEAVRNIIEPEGEEGGEG